jgi:hypothetical protein
MVSTEIEDVWQRTEIPNHINVLVHLEYHTITGHQIKFVARSEERKWAADLAQRLNKCIEKPKTYDCYSLCSYISFLQYGDTNANRYSFEERERIAVLIKDYLLTFGELEAYNDYVASFEKRL